VNFASLRDRRAEQDPHGPAISDGPTSLTNAQLLHRVRTASHHLCDWGIGAGDVVAFKLRNRIEFVRLLLLLKASLRAALPRHTSHDN
jgi:long-chain acyl-CoA synthetase